MNLIKDLKTEITEKDEALRRWSSVWEDQFAREGADQRTALAAIEELCASVRWVSSYSLHTDKVDQLTKMLEIQRLRDSHC